MTEWGAQVILSDRALAKSEVRDRARELLRLSFEREAPTAEIHYGEARYYQPPSHDSTEYPDCPWARFARAHPGADHDEYPECGDDSHWFPGGWINEINAWCDDGQA